MLPQAAESDFVLKTKNLAISPRGIEVEIPTAGRLVYRKNGEEISLRIDFEDLHDAFLTTYVFFPEKPNWASGKIISIKELQALQVDIRDGLVAFGSLVIFYSRKEMEELRNVSDAEGDEHE